MTSIIDEIKSNVDIVEYIGQYVDLTVKGKNYVGLCPFHQDNDPSFKVSPDKNIFKCFGCGKGGNIFNFVTLYHKVDFGESIRILSEYLGFEEKSDYDEYYHWMKNFQEDFVKGHNDISTKYLEDRDIHLRTITSFGVGFISNSFFDKGNDDELLVKLGVLYKRRDEHHYRFPGCLTFPFFNDSNKVVGFSFMRIDRRPDEPKYENSWTTPIFKKRELLFGLKLTKDKIRATGNAYLVEGYFDAMRMYQNPFCEAVVAVCGSIMTDEQVINMKRNCHRVEIHFDGDEAGREGAIKSGFKCEEAGLDVYIYDYPDGKDPDNSYKETDIIKRYNVPKFFIKYKKDASAVDVLLQHASKIKNLDVVSDYIKEIKEWYDIPTSLITSRMANNATPSGYKMKKSEFSIQKEIIKAIIQGWIDPTTLDESKFSREYKANLGLLIISYRDNGFVNLDNLIMSQYSQFLEPMSVTMEELNPLLIPYKNYSNIDELIKAKNKLHL